MGVIAVQSAAPYAGSGVETENSWQTSRPAPVLAPFVEHYTGYRMLGHAPGIHRGLPSANMTFIVAIGPTIDVVQQTDAAQPPASYRCVVGGLQVTPAMIAHDGNQEGVGIELTPLGARALLGLPARELWNTGVELADLVGPIADELAERLHLVGTWSERFAVCDDVLSRLLREELVVPELRRSWELLVTSSGTIPVTELASEVGWTRQHLGRRFGDEFGLSPKLAARVIRFSRARTMLQSTPSFISIAQVAAACGYYDQAHLDRDFNEFAGCSPSRWMAEEDLPIFQDAEELEPSSSGHD